MSTGSLRVDRNGGAGAKSFALPCRPLGPAAVESLELVLDVYPHATAGSYVGIVRHAAVLTMFRRRTLRLLFDLHSALDEPPLHLGVPGFWPIPANRRTGAARLSRLMQLAGLNIPRRGPWPLHGLLNRPFRVEVGDVTVSRDRLADGRTPRPLHPSQVYSVVRHVAEGL